MAISMRLVRRFRSRSSSERILPCFPDPAIDGAGQRVGDTVTPSAGTFLGIYCSGVRLAIAATIDAQKRPRGESFNDQAIQSAQVSHLHEIWWVIILYFVVFISFFAILHSIRPFLCYFFFVYKYVVLRLELEYRTWWPIDAIYISVCRSWLRTKRRKRSYCITSPLRWIQFWWLIFIPPLFPGQKWSAAQQFSADETKQSSTVIEMAHLNFFSASTEAPARRRTCPQCPSLATTSFVAFDELTDVGTITTTIGCDNNSVADWLLYVRRQQHHYKLIISQGNHPPILILKEILSDTFMFMNICLFTHNCSLWFINNSLWFICKNTNKYFSI